MYDSQTEENNCYNSIIIEKNCLKCDIRIFTLWNWEKNGVIIRCNLYTI